MQKINLLTPLEYFAILSYFLNNPHYFLYEYRAFYYDYDSRQYLPHQTRIFNVLGLN